MRKTRSFSATTHIGSIETICPETRLESTALRAILQLFSSTPATSLNQPHPSQPLQMTPPQRLSSPPTPITDCKNNPNPILCQIKSRLYRNLKVPRTLHVPPVAKPGLHKTKKSPINAPFAKVSSIVELTVNEKTPDFMRARFAKN